VTERDEFSVAVFYPDGTHSYISRWVSSREAVTTAMILAKRARRTFDRIIVTDGGDGTVFCWEHGKGITWLTPEERTK
jgi:hypothetical protein